MALALLGGTLGVALDALHVASGTTSYREPWMFGIATWTIPLFATAGALLGLGPVVIEHVLASRGMLAAPEPKDAWRAGLAMLSFVVAYLTSCVLRGALAAVVLVAIAALAWWIADRRAIGIAHAGVAGLTGAAVEIGLVAMGAFTHHDTGLFGVAVWLPCLYLSASVATSALARRLVEAGGAARRRSRSITSSGARAAPSAHADGSRPRPRRATTVRR